MLFLRSRLLGTVTRRQAPRASSSIPQRHSNLGFDIRPVQTRTMSHKPEIISIEEYKTEAKWLKLENIKWKDQTGKEVSMISYLPSGIAQYALICREGGRSQIGRRGVKGVSIVCPLVCLSSAFHCVTIFAAQLDESEAYH